MPKKLHWTQTPAGKRKMSRLSKKGWLTRAAKAAASTPTPIVTPTPAITEKLYGQVAAHVILHGNLNDFLGMLGAEMVHQGTDLLHQVMDREGDREHKASRP